MTSTAARASSRPVFTAGICLALLMIYAALAWTAVSTKCATVDEPYHLIAGWTHLHWGDYRVDCEHPPLWQYWALLPNGAHAVNADPNSYFFNQLTSFPYAGVAWCVKVLYQTAGNDPVVLLQRSRFMMLLVAAALAAAISLWSWQMAGALGLCGSISAIAAATLFSLDPNFLAHGPLVKNDVVFMLGMTVLMSAIWNMGRGGTLLNLLAVLLSAALLPCVKFSGVLAAVLLPGALIIRALLPRPWSILGYYLNRRTQRLAAATAVTLAAAVLGVLLIWACYGFRFRASVKPNQPMNYSLLERRVINSQLIARTGRIPPPDQVDAAVAPAFVRLMGWILHHHLLPEAWMTGLVFTYQSMIVNDTYLFGRLSETGWWYYFPVAMAVKTPIATLAAAALAMTLIASRLRRSFWSGFDRLWAASCLVLPVVIYGASALHSNLNMGMRHILPIYPFGFVAIALATSWAWPRWPRLAPSLAIALMLGLATAAIASFPDYIPFFNAFAGGERGGFYILGDSNLDWGQDLPLLALWRQQHPQGALYLNYFGLADPAAYGLEYINLPGGNYLGTEERWPTRPGVLAISATSLQGIYVEPGLRPWYRAVSQAKPRLVLGGSIYLYDFPSPDIPVPVR